MNKVAKLVAVSLMTRVVVDESATEEEILDAARPQFMEKINSELGENLESIEDDTECPYGSIFSDEPYHKKKAVVERFLRFILPDGALTEYLEEVYDNEDCDKDPLEAVLNNAWLWYSGGESKNYHVYFMPDDDNSENMFCYISDPDTNQRLGSVTLTGEEAKIMNFEYYEDDDKTKESIS